MPRPDLIETRKEELRSYVTNFYRRSWDWRSQHFHRKWDRFDRMYHSIYDPEVANQKEPWQAKMFVNLTVQNVEIITSQLFKTLFGMKPPIKTEAGPAGDELQAELITETFDYETQKARFDLASYDALKEAVRYGNGFVKLFWERVEDVRNRRIPIDQTPQEVIETAPPEALSGQIPLPSPALKGFSMQQVPVLIKNALGAKYVHIRDIFPDPNTTDWVRILHRDKIDYGTIVRHIQRGEFLDVRDKLDTLEEGDKFEEDLQTIKHDLGYFEATRQMAKFEKKHTIWEFWGPIPRKWVQFDIDEGDEAEELVPGKVMVASKVALLASEINTSYDGEHPFVKIPYIRTGQTYDKGVCEMIGDDQDYANEIVNQRLDNVNLILNKGIAVIESALVNAEADMKVQPGWVLRFKQQMDDLKKSFVPIEFPDVTASAYRETLEIERRVQETTGANRVTLGSSGLVKDTNQTLGGMELLKQMFNERVAAYGLVIESDYLLRAASKIYGLIYQNLDPQEMKYILGEEPVTIDVIMNTPVQVPRFLAFAFVPPEEINRSYRIKAVGVFSMENKIVKSAQVMDLIKVMAMDPRFDLIGAMKYVAVTLQGIQEAEKWFLNIPMPMMPPQMPNKKEMPGMKSGPNGDSPTFLPPSPNPLNRQPVA